MTELVFILDRSGSMSGLEKDTTGGFNSMIEKQARKGGKAVVSTVLFNGCSTVIHDRIDIKDVPRLGDEDYCAAGSTALLDAVGEAIKHIGNIHKYARREDVPEKTLFVITTDGMENSSTVYSYEAVKQMICHKQERYGWEFIFLGANIDAAAEAGRIGIAKKDAINYNCDPKGTALNYEFLNDAVDCARSNIERPEYLRKRIDEDFKSRKRDKNK